MGEADSTASVGNDGLRLFNSYQKNNSEPFIEDMTEEYVDKENIKVPLTDYSNWLATIDITKYFDEYLQSNSTININASTLKNYLSKVVLMFKDKFPKHCAWEESKWTTRVSVKEFDKKFNHEQGRGNVDLSEDTNNRLYIKSSSFLNEIDYHWISNIYLEQANLNLMKTSEHGYTYRPLHKRVMVNLTK